MCVKPHRSLHSILVDNWFVDAMVVCMATMAVYVYASRNDILERVVALSERHEDWELDELITALVFLCFGMLVFSWRRRYEMRQARNALLAQNSELEKALAEVKLLRGILPICASCKRIRDDKGYWHQVEAYIHDHTDAQFSHGICPECMRKLYPEYCDDVEDGSPDATGEAST